VECTTTGMPSMYVGFGQNYHFRGIFDAGDGTHVWILYWITDYSGGAGNWSQRYLELYKVAIDIVAKTATVVTSKSVSVGPIVTGIIQTNLVVDGTNLVGVASWNESYTAPNTYSYDQKFLLWSWDMDTAPDTVTTIKQWSRKDDSITAPGGSVLIKDEDDALYLLDFGYGWSGNTSITLISDTEMTQQDETIPISMSNGQVSWGIDTSCWLVHIDVGQYTYWKSARWDPGSNGYTTYDDGRNPNAEIGTGLPGDIQDHYYVDGDPLLVVEVPQAVYV